MNRRLVFNRSFYFRRENRGIALCAVFSLMLLPGTLRAAGRGEQRVNGSSGLSAKVSESIRTISRDRSTSVVRIRCHDGNGEIVGTGFSIDPTGTIITLAEIVRGAQDIMVEQAGQTFPATLTAIDPRSGVAFLKISSAKDSAAFLPPLPISNAPALTPVVSIGYPREQQATPVLGMITGSKNHEDDAYYCVTHLTASIPLSEGEGGSPVLDLNGNLLGIVITGNTQLGTCTILPSSAIEQLHHNLLRYGGINPGWVGAVVEIAAVPQKNSRTRVVSVVPGSPAESAGIRPGDTLLALGSHAIHTPDDVLDASFYLSAGEPLQVTLVREGTTQRLVLHCGERPLPDEDIGSASPVPPVSLVGESAR